MRAIPLYLNKWQSNDSKITRISDIFPDSYNTVSNNWFRLHQCWSNFYYNVNTVTKLLLLVTALLNDGVLICIGAVSAKGAKAHHEITSFFNQNGP